MNRALLIACFALSAIALALSLVPRDAPVTVPSSYAGGVTYDDLEILEKRIDAVEDLNRDLLNKVAQLERGGAGAVVVAGDAGSVPAALAAELVQLRNEVHGMVAGEALNSEGGKQFLKDTLRELQVEEQRGRMEQQAQRAAERDVENKAQWKKFIGDAKLTYPQEQALMGALDAETQKRQALMDEVKAGTKDYRDVMRSTRDLRRDTDKTVKGSLDEAQQKQYDQLRREQNQPRGGWGGGQRGQRSPGEDGARSRP